MSFLTTNYSDNKQSTGFTALPTGEYEMLIVNAQEKATPSGAESLQIDLVVRNDLNGVPSLLETNAKHNNRLVFNDNWKRKATGMYDSQGFQYILEAAQVPEGTPINSVMDFICLLIGKPVRVYVKQEENTYNGTTTTVNRIAPWNYKKTEFPAVQHVLKKKETPASTNAADPFAGRPVLDSEMPF